MKGGPILFITEPAAHSQAFKNSRQIAGVAHFEFRFIPDFILPAPRITGRSGSRPGNRLFERKHQTSFRILCFGLSARLRRLRSNAKQLPVLGQSTFRRIEYYVFLMDSLRSLPCGARADALQDAAKRPHVSDLQLDFCLLRHLVAIAPEAAAFSRRRLPLV